MSKLPAFLVASALLTAACGTAATPSSSAVQPASAATVHVNAAPNADSGISDITNRPNPPGHPGGASSQTKPQTPAAVVVPPAGEAIHSGGWDRCGGGIGVGLAGNRSGSASPGPKKPVPECNIQ